MRPVEKKKPGYKPYATAKEPLAANLGSFCSYCEERRALADLHIDHIEPKSKTGALYDWENFLLSCNICNSCKLDGDVNLDNVHFPHRDNTFLDFIYDESGRVKVNPALPEDEYARALNLYNLVKMGRDPFSEEAASQRDFRWKSRFETWKLAVRYLDKYKSGMADVEDIIELSKGYGHWSIWFTVFKGIDEVRKALIEFTPGTCADCFDSENHFEPVARKK